MPRIHKGPRVRRKKKPHFKECTWYDFNQDGMFDKINEMLQASGTDWRLKPIIDEDGLFHNVYPGKVV